MLVLRAALDLFVALLEPLAVALWAVDGQVRRLVWSDRVDRRDLEALSKLGERDWRALEGGGAVFTEGPFTWVVSCLAAGKLRALLQFRPRPEATELPRRHLPLLGELIAFGLRGDAGQGGSQPGREAQDVATRAARESLVHLLDRHDWNVMRTARVLGVSRVTVYNHMRRLDIPRKHVRLTPRRGPAADQVAC